MHIFFFKQKAAYDMRISDWSSDVCSSDLSWYDSGYLKKAGSIEELAGLLNIEPATLRASIERFNGFVRQNRDDDFHRGERAYDRRSEEHTSELQSLMRTSYAVFCLKKQKIHLPNQHNPSNKQHTNTTYNAHNTSL